jgi:hypothetical protein
VQLEETVNELNKTIKSLRTGLRTQEKSSGVSIRDELATSQTALRAANQKVDSLMRILRLYEKKHECETLYGRYRICDAAHSLLEIKNTKGDDLGESKVLVDWIDGGFRFRSQCILFKSCLQNSRINVYRGFKLLQMRHQLRKNMTKH